jgi:glycosyltransferase involved in cell wall biosynthesis
MRVLHICPLVRPVTVDSEGAVERALACLVEALDASGCENTVLASGGSALAGELIPVVETGLADGSPPGLIAPAAYMHEVMWASEHGRYFDVIHCHIPLTGYVLRANDELCPRLLYTAHGPLSEGLEWLVRRHPGAAFTSVSRQTSEWLRRAGAAGCEPIPEAVAFNRLALRPRAGDTLVFAGEISSRAGADAAIGVARALRRRLVLVGPIPPGGERFFAETVEPRLGGEVQYRGDLLGAEKLELLASAACAISPVQRPAAFPLSAVEAMACGTPVVALADGATAEVIEPGATGFVVGEVAGLAGGAEAAMALDRARVRSCARSRFDAGVIARRYFDRYTATARAPAGRAVAAAGVRQAPAQVRRLPLRVLQVGPTGRPVSLDAPGGIEALLAHLIPALEPLGCGSTLLADVRSEVDAADMIPVDRAADMSRQSPEERQAHAAHVVMEATERGEAFDVIHNHNRHAFPLSAVEALAGRVLHTLHHPASPSLCWIVSHHPRMRFAVPSEFQARRLREAGLASVHVVPNGVDLSAFPFRADPAPQLAFVGGLRPQKGPDIALQVAAEAKLPITLAGPIDGGNRHFFDTCLRPLLNGSARYVGVLGPAEKVALLGGASCLVMPSRWEEPFGMVAIEAMACGTPVVGLSNGALPEIVKEDVGGYLATSAQEMPALVRRACRLDRRRVRAYAASRFDISLTARRYAELYREMAER